MRNFRYLTYSLVLHSLVLGLGMLHVYFNSPSFVLKNTSGVMQASIIPTYPLSVTRPNLKTASSKALPILPPAKVAQTVTPSLQKNTPSVAISIPKKPLKTLAHQTLKHRPPLEKPNKQKQQVAVQKAFEEDLKILQKKFLQHKEQALHAHQSNMQGIVNEYKARILQAISEHWLIPPNINKKLYAELFIRLGPGGVVVEVQLTKTSGDKSLDQSARAAVYKASPLPVPQNTEAFLQFRQFILKVTPKDIVDSERLG